MISNSWTQSSFAEPWLWGTYSIMHTNYGLFLMVSWLMPGLDWFSLPNLILPCLEVLLIHVHIRVLSFHQYGIHEGETPASPMVSPSFVVSLLTPSNFFAFFMLLVNVFFFHLDLTLHHFLHCLHPWRFIDLKMMASRKFMRSHLSWDFFFLEFLFFSVLHCFP